MSEIVTPDAVIAELNRLIGEAQRGIEALYSAEVKVAELDAEHEKTYSLALLQQTGGTAPERQAQAKLAALQARLDLDLSRAELSRVKAKLRAIDSAQVAVSVIAKQVELMFRHG
jgi:hypothetical protein